MEGLTGLAGLVGLEVEMHDEQIGMTSVVAMVT